MVVAGDDVREGVPGVHNHLTGTWSLRTGMICCQARGYHCRAIERC